MLWGRTKFRAKIGHGDFVTIVTSYVAGKTTIRAVPKGRTKETEKVLVYHPKTAKGDS